MSDASARDELINKKIELSEQRIETRLVGIEGKLDRVLDRVADATSAANRAQEAANEARKAAIVTRWNVVFFVITGVAVILAVMALGVQMLDLATGLFSAGKG